MNFVVLGPGFTSSEVKGKNLENYKVFAFQNTFPNCIEHLDLVPDVWFSADPFAFVEGFMFLIEKREEGSKLYKDLQIYVPKPFIGTFHEYRDFFGTTPLMQIQDGWDKFQNLLENVRQDHAIIPFECTTTKYIATREPKYSKIQKIFEDEFERFLVEKVVFGSVPYDSETVVGDEYKWGLENKLTSSVLPLLYSLGAKKNIIFGFDFIGPRFYSDVERHPWNDETHTSSGAVNFPLKILKKWESNLSTHGMILRSGSKSKKSLITRVLPHEKI